ncbi:MAG: SMP-30/gluconolactonase/LRE family protein [Myxococcota bacterium]
MGIRLGRALRPALALLVAAGCYLALWPVSIDPVGWEPPAPPEMTGPLARNDRLLSAERLAVDAVEGPEDVAVASDGRMFVGTHDGKIAEISSDGTVVATVAETGGRPLGLAWDAEGNLVIADAVKGLLRMSPDGALTTLSTESDGIAFGFTDDVDIAKDGRIYFTDASHKYGYGHHMEDTLEGRPHGRLLRYDPAQGSTETLASDLYFANGIALAPDDSFVLVNETTRFRVTRFWLTGDKAGTSEVFADGLPGYPDGISRGPRGTFWVALFTIRNPTADRLAPSPFLTKVVWRLPKFLLPKPVPYGLALELDATGNIVRSLHDAKGETVATVTSVEEVDGSLYFGTLRRSQVARLPLPG